MSWLCLGCVKKMAPTDKNGYVHLVCDLGCRAGPLPGIGIQNEAYRLSNLAHELLHVFFRPQIRQPLGGDQAEKTGL